VKILQKFDTFKDFPLFGSQITVKMVLDSIWLIRLVNSWSPNFCFTSRVQRYSCHI